MDCMEFKMLINLFRVWGAASCQNKKNFFQQLDIFLNSLPRGKRSIVLTDFIARVDFMQRE